MEGNLQHITRSVFGTDHLEEVPLEDLRLLIEEFPSFNAGHFLLSRKLKQESPEEFLQESQITALYFTNPFWLSLQLDQQPSGIWQEMRAEAMNGFLGSPENTQDAQWEAGQEIILDEEAMASEEVEDRSLPVDLETTVIENPVIPEKDASIIDTNIESFGTPESLHETVESGIWAAPVQDQENQSRPESVHILEGQPGETEIPQSLAEIALSGMQNPEEESPVSFHTESEPVGTWPEAENPENKMYAEEAVASENAGLIEDPDAPDLHLAREESIESGGIPAPEREAGEEVPVVSEEKLWIAGSDLPADKPDAHAEEQPKRPHFFWEKEFYSKLPQQGQEEAEETKPDTEEFPAPDFTIEKTVLDESPARDHGNGPEAILETPTGSDDTIKEQVVFEEEPLVIDFSGLHREEPVIRPYSGSEESAPDLLMAQAETQIPVPGQEEEPVEELTFTPYHSVDYFASQGIFYQDENPTDKFGKQLKSFTAWLKTMKRLPKAMLAAEMNELTEATIQDIAEHSIEEKEVLTEAMAEVLALQGKNEKAVELYQKLSLLNPSKSAYFAARIDQLKVK